MESVLNIVCCLYLYCTAVVVKRTLQWRVVPLITTCLTDR